MGKSEVSDASHREPVTRVGWMRNPELDGRAAGVWGGHDDGTYELVSAGSDGRVLVWDASDVSHPAYGYELTAVNEASAMTTGGVVRGLDGWEPGSFYAIGRRAGVQVCARLADRRLDSGVAPPMYSPVKQTHDGQRARRSGVREPSRPEGLRDVRRRRRPAGVHATRAGGCDGDVGGAVRRGVVADEAGADRVRRRRRLYDLTATGGEDVQPTEQFRRATRARTSRRLRSTRRCPSTWPRRMRDRARV